METLSTKTERQVRNFGANLTATARKCPDALAVAEVVARKQGRALYRETDFRSLEDYSNHMAAALKNLGIREGMHTVVMVTPGRELSALMFALLKLGAVPVLVDPGLGLKNLKTCLREAEPEAFIGVARAHLARMVLRWGSESLKLFISVGPGKFGGLFRGGRPMEKLLKAVDRKGVAHVYLAAFSHEVPLAQVPAGQVACIAFTSGSTGAPKGVVFTHEMMNAQIDAIASINDLSDVQADLTTFPLFSIFLPVLGVASVFPEMDFSIPGKANPAYLREAIEAYHCGSMFASPAIVELLGKYCVQESLKLEHLRVVFSAGAPARNESLERFRNVMSETGQIYNAYGATEALPVSCIESETMLLETRFETEQGAGVCVGKPVAGVDVFVIPITDEAIPLWSEDLPLKSGEIGELVVRGPNVTLDYYNRPVQTQLAKIKDPRTGDVFHRMGDIGRIDEQGRLWMCGRKSHRVSQPDGDLYSVSCEGIFNQHKHVFRTALVGVNIEGESIVPVICVELHSKPLSKIASVELEQIRRDLLQIGGSHDVTRPIQTVLFFDEFPVDVRHNAKIFRESLAKQATEILKKKMGGKKS